MVFELFWGNYIVDRRNKMAKSMFRILSAQISSESGIFWAEDTGRGETDFQRFVGNKANERISKRVLQENKVHPFWDSPFCLIANDLNGESESEWR